MLGIVEAKKLSPGPRNVLAQAQRDSAGVTDSPFHFGEFRVPFLFFTNGEVVRFHDVRHPPNAPARWPTTRPEQPCRQRENAGVGGAGPLGDRERAALGSRRGVRGGRQSGAGGARRRELGDRPTGGRVPAESRPRSVTFSPPSACTSARPSSWPNRVPCPLSVEGRATPTALLPTGRAGGITATCGRRSKSCSGARPSNSGRESSTTSARPAKPTWPGGGQPLTRRLFMAGQRAGGGGTALPPSPRPRLRQGERDGAERRRKQNRPRAGTKRQQRRNRQESWRPVAVCSIPADPTRMRK